MGARAVPQVRTVEKAENSHTERKNTLKQKAWSSQEQPEAARSRHEQTRVVHAIIQFLLKVSNVLSLQSWLLGKCQRL